MADLMSGTVDPETLYTKQQCIGGGSFGKVYKGIDRRTGNVVAIKVIDVENAEDEVDDIITEISILSGMKSKYVTQYFGSHLHGSDLWIVMEFCSGGSCVDLMKPGVFDEPAIAVVMRELLQGLNYLHDDHKLHRDIKAANILVSAKGEVKLADFGVSGQLSVTMTKKNTFVGTPFWMAPEVIKQSGYDGKADIWSTGITALELANGEPPYADIHPMKVLFLIPKNPPPVLTGNFSPQFKEFVDLCLRKDPRERPTAKQLLQTAFIRKAGKTARLQELISRYQDYQLHHPKQEDSGDESTPQKKKTINEDLWDFGTVRPAKYVPRPAGPVLSPMTAAGANARNVSPTRRPVPRQGAENINLDTEDTVRYASPISPTKEASQVPLPASPLKSYHDLPPLPSTRSGADHLKKSSVPQLFSPHPPARNPLVTPEKQPIQPPRRFTPLARDYDDYLQREIAADMELMEIGTTPNKPTPTRGSVLPRLNLDIPAYQGKSSGEPTNENKPLGRVQDSGVNGHGSSGSGEQQSGSDQYQEHTPPQSPVPPTPAPTPNHVNNIGRHIRTSIPPPALGPMNFGTPPKDKPLPAIASPGADHLSGQKPLPPFNPLPNEVPNSRPSSSARNFGGPPVLFGNLAPRGSKPGTPTELGSPADLQVASKALPSSPDTGADITAIHGVVVPALEAAVARRTHQLNLKNREESVHAYKDPTGFMERRRERTEAHEQVKKIVRHLVDDFKALDRWDSKAQVGMGGDVMNFLEGFLEEVLVRVEPSDDI